MFEEFSKDELVVLIKHILHSTQLESNHIAISQNTKVKLNAYKGTLRYDEAIKKLLKEAEING